MRTAERDRFESAVLFRGPFKHVLGQLLKLRHVPRQFGTGAQRENRVFETVDCEAAYYLGANSRGGHPGLHQPTSFQRGDRDEPNHPGRIVSRIEGELRHQETRTGVANQLRTRFEDPEPGVVDEVAQLINGEASLEGVEPTPMKLVGFRIDL